MPHQPLFEKVLISQSTFLMKEEHFNRFDIPWHAHPEFELTLITQGQGRIHIGDHVSELNGPELLLLGPNLPHSWYGPLSESGKELSKQIVIQFPLDFLGENFFENPAFREVKNLLDISYRGLQFERSEAEQLKDRISGVLQLNEFERTIELLQLLQALSVRKKYFYLSSMGYSKQLNQSESVRLNTIYAYILDHFKSHIDLGAVAGIANMTPQAFSRYFKERTRKTFVSFLNEVRIGYACQLLTESDMDISRICYECGYSNLSNFNRQFKRIKSMTPSQYMKGFEKSSP